eukprot:8146749-Heterocapsa_arctica.AAC.2
MTDYYIRSTGLISFPGGPLAVMHPRPPRITVQLTESESEGVGAISVIVQLQAHESEQDIRYRMGTFWAIDLGHYNAFLNKVILSPQGVLLAPTAIQ